MQYIYSSVSNTIFFYICVKLILHLLVNLKIKILSYY